MNAIRLRPALILLLLCGAAGARPTFTELQFNPKWYRTFNGASDILPAEGGLLFNWIYSDPDNRPDSFYVGIDTLWGLPQNVEGDTAADWDLQVCPDEICMNGLKAGVHGANAAYPFQAGKFKAEHHFQFFPAIDKRTFDFISPARGIFGGLMYCRSRTTRISDTVLGYGAWNLSWDTAHVPPVRPVEGYLPKFSDFVLSGDTVRYLKGASGIRNGAAGRTGRVPEILAAFGSEGLRIRFGGIPERKTVRIYGVSGSRLADPRSLPKETSEVYYGWESIRARAGTPAILIIRISWSNGSVAKAVPVLFP